MFAFGSIGVDDTIPGKVSVSDWLFRNKRGATPSLPISLYLKSRSHVKNIVRGS